MELVQLSSHRYKISIECKLLVVAGEGFSMFQLRTDEPAFVLKKLKAPINSKYKSKCYELGPEIC